MFTKNAAALCAILMIIFSYHVKAINPVKPATPDASPEAVALLKLIHSISGKYILTGQHNYPNIRDTNSRFASKYIGKRPAIFSTDWGFAADGDTDSYLARPDIVDEAIKQHKAGSIITICWHAVPPTADEPVTFQQKPGNTPEMLASVQGRLKDDQFKDLFTKGTALHEKWVKQVDNIAFYLKKLDVAHVPILWRPYHEMNGDWFWWGGHTGEYSTKRLYIQLFERLTNHHKIRNLIWVWSVDRPNKPEMEFMNYYPGNKYLDVVALDVYGNDFKQEYYDALVKIANGKPLVLGEVGNPPAPEILDKQPIWGYYVTWAGMVRNTTKKQYSIIMKDKRFLNQDDPVFAELTAPYRDTCGFPRLSVETPVTDFQGKWIFNEEKSVLDRFGVSSGPYMISVLQDENSITITKRVIVEYADDQNTDDKYLLDGRKYPSKYMNMPAETSAGWSDDKRMIKLHTDASYNKKDQKPDVSIDETWNIDDSNDTLLIRQVSKTPWGERNISMVYDRVRE